MIRRLLRDFRLKVKRSSQWRSVRRTHLKQQPKCVICESADKLEVHHKLPVHIDPTRELDPTNLITLCESRRVGFDCHFCVGHLMNWRNYNPAVEQDARMMNAKLRESGKIP